LSVRRIASIIARWRRTSGEHRRRSSSGSFPRSFSERSESESAECSVSIAAIDVELMIREFRPPPTLMSGAVSRSRVSPSALEGSPLGSPLSAAALGRGARIARSRRSVVGRTDQSVASGMQMRRSVSTEVTSASSQKF
jgi:hypothetical protein|tara:strand:+ start:635 stop:1051 length:417 start_codon:yes stop_codon:yes gene_type:complete